MGEHNIEIFNVRWSPDDALLAAACSDGTVKLYNPMNGML